MIPKQKRTAKKQNGVGGIDLEHRPPQPPSPLLPLRSWILYWVPLGLYDNFEQRTSHSDTWMCCILPS